MKKAYSFCDKTNTGVIHIFKGTFDQDGKCDTDKKSICKKMSRYDGDWLKNNSCFVDDVARKKAAEVGREVCGDCVSHLYKTY